MAIVDTLYESDTPCTCGSILYVIKRSYNDTKDKSLPDYSDEAYCHDCEIWLGFI